MPDPITIYSLSRVAVDDAGGMLLRIIGDFADQFGVAYNIHIGTTGTTADAKGYAGISGRITTLYVWNATEIRCYMPLLEKGTTVSVLIRAVDGSREQLIPDALEVLPQQYYGSVFELRALLPPQYLLGPRNMENLEPVS